MFSDIVLDLASIGAFNKLQFYILKYNKGNKNMLISNVWGSMYFLYCWLTNNLLHVQIIITFVLNLLIKVSS